MQVKICLYFRVLRTLLQRGVFPILLVPIIYNLNIPPSTYPIQIIPNEKLVLLDLQVDKCTFIVEKHPVILDKFDSRIKDHEDCGIGLHNHSSISFRSMRISSTSTGSSTSGSTK